MTITDKQTHIEHTVYCIWLYIVYQGKPLAPTQQRKYLSKARQNSNPATVQQQQVASQSVFSVELLTDSYPITPFAHLQMTSLGSQAQRR